MKLDSIRNKDGIWVNTQAFREAGNHFMKYGYYTADPWGSPAWYDFWKEERRRVIEGYSVGGCKITGDHYFYMNYCPIQKVDDTSGLKSKKIKGFADFWDGDYNYFWVREIARSGILDASGATQKEQTKIDNLPSVEQATALKIEFEKLGLEVKIQPEFLKGGFNLIVGKSRRKGYSFKNASVAVKNYYTKPGLLTIFNAYEKKFLYPKGIMTMSLSYINFINTNTGWAMPSDYVQRTDHVRASYVEYKNGNKLEQGFMSEIMALTCKDNADVNRGKDAEDIIIEEAGAFGTPGLLKDVYLASQDCVMGGAVKTGMITIFGCVCKGTKVWNHIGEEVNIEDITLDSGIIGYAGTGTTKEPIVYLKPPGKKACVRITTNKGFKIECSKDHPLLWSKNKFSYHGNKKVMFKKAENILVGEQIMRVRQVPIFGKKQMKYPRLVGLMIGDGYYGNKSTPQLCIADEGIFDYLNSLDINYTVYKKCDETDYKYIGIKNYQNELRLLGIYGQTKLNKRLPDNIQEYNLHSIKELLGGYFDADGSINYNKRKDCYKITLTSTVRELLVQVENLLFKLGIRCTIFKRLHYAKNSLIVSKVNNKTSTIKSGVSYSLEIHSIEDVIEFKKHIKFTDNKKQRILNSVNKNKKGRNKYDNCIFVESNEISNVFFDNNNIECNNLEACYVTKVEDIGLQDVYNLHAGTTHTYITNGFISKNTSGDMEGGTYDYADMFTRPEAFGLLPFQNIWDKESESVKVGFFHPYQWNTEGYYDEQGNSDVEGAIDLELNVRKKLVENGATSTEIQRRMQEKPLGPGEAFATVSTNTFPVVELKKQLQKVKGLGLQQTKGTPVSMSYEGRAVKTVPILDGSREPIISYYNVPSDKRGCPVVYEYPITDAPKGLYKIGYDPVRQELGTSLAAICVYKGVHVGSVYHSILVAEYVGRMEDIEDIDKIAEMFADFYNTTIMYENEVTGVKNYFRRIKRLSLLAHQPDAVISKNVKNSRVARVYGCHMNLQLKDAGERYVKTWLMTILDYDEFDNPIRVIDRIYSLRLLEELIAYNRKGNFDIVSSLFMCMFQVQEEVLGKEYSEKEIHKNAKNLLSMMDELYKKN